MKAILGQEKEIREIFSHIKALISAQQEAGFDPPPLSDKGREIFRGEKESGGLETLEDLQEFIGDCRKCRLCRSRRHLVFGEGDPHARLVFVGEAPGRDEDLAGRPFVGDSGKQLTKIIENGMRLTRQEVYICNVVKCHPPGNRDPERDEIEACLPFLKNQLRIIRPEVICVLGRIAGQALLGHDFKITTERGKWHSYEDIPLIATFHPAYLLRNPSAKRQVWEDIQKIMEFLALEV